MWSDGTRSSSRKWRRFCTVYKEVEIVNQGLVTGTIGEAATVTVSYDEKPGIQALGVTTLDRPPVPGTHASHLRDYEYKRLGTVSLLAGLDLHTGRVTKIVNNTHKSSDFIEFLTKLDATYPATQTLRLILDNLRRISRKKPGDTSRHGHNDFTSFSSPNTAPG